MAATHVKLRCQPTGACACLHVFGLVATNTSLSIIGCAVLIRSCQERGGGHRREGAPHHYYGRL